jgi:hypothetical protein
VHHQAAIDECTFSNILRKTLHVVQGDTSGGLLS